MTAYQEAGQALPQAAVGAIARRGEQSWSVTRCAGKLAKMLGWRWRLLSVRQGGGKRA